MTQPTAQHAHDIASAQRRPSRALSRFTSVALSALLAMGLTVVAATPASAATTVQNATELSAAFAAGGSVTLDASFAVTPPTQIAVPANGTVELDLNGHTLTIIGATNNAGIGVPAGATLTITDSGGGELSTTGGHRGAGIGGNNLGTTGTINISGGTIDARGGIRAPGVGGGDHGTAGTINISGGTVTATGGEYAAGIGGGDFGHSGTINISGGTVTAAGGISGAGIGGGNKANGGTIDISGGVVDAYAGEYASAIGGGDIGGTGGTLSIGQLATVTVSASPVSPRYLLGAGFPGLELGSISNSGSLTITPGSIFVIPNGTSVTNAGTLNVDGEVQNAGLLVNTGGVINVDGAVTNTGTIDNAGGVLNAPVGTVAGNDFLITFDEGYVGGALPTTMRVLSKTLDSAALAAIPTPARVGHTFVAWVESPTTTPFDFSGTIVSDVNLTATWAINAHTVTFDSAGGTPVAPESTDYGTTVAAPSAPTRDGYTFVGWFADAATTAFDFTAPITANTTLTARWAAETRTVTFDSAGGTLVAAVSADYGTTVAAPNAPTRDGYTFVGWFADAATAAFDFTAPITANTTLTARWLALPANTTTTDALVAGSAVTVTGTGFTPGQSVQVWLHSSPVRLGTLTVAANGTVSGVFPIPLTTPAGPHHIVFVDESGAEYRSGTITVTAAPAVPTPTPTPTPTSPPTAAAAIASTGADTTGPLQIAVALLLIGAAAVGIRKRKAHTA